MQCNILGGAEGFVPVSHLGSLGTQLTFAEGEEADEEARNALIGKVIDVKFLEYDEGDGHMTLSARRAESADYETKFQIGQVVEGVVSKVLEFGLFVDVAGGGTGLLHVSQISHDRVQDLSTLMDVGDRIKARFAIFWTCLIWTTLTWRACWLAWSLISREVMSHACLPWSVLWVELLEFLQQLVAAAAPVALLPACRLRAATLPSTLSAAAAHRHARRTVILSAAPMPHQVEHPCSAAENAPRCRS